MVIKIKALSLIGLEGYAVDVEVDLYSGLPAFYIIGLPDKSLQEAVHRVKSAIKNSGFKFPQGKIVVNLSPANLLKSGTGFDFAIALGILAVSKQITHDFSRNVFWGELSLDGSAKFIKGTLAAACVARDLGFENIVIPELNATEAGIVAGINIKIVKDLKQLAKNDSYGIIPQIDFNKLVLKQKFPPIGTINFSQIKGQYYAKRALEIAAAGGHNLIMSGPPGSGKTMLSQAFCSILPPLGWEEALVVSKIYSIAGLLNEKQKIIIERPFRAPHHTASKISLVGGGSNLKPGEITLAHHGVLFLDEMNEFASDTLEALRQPLENKTITVVRISGNVLYPADFILLAAVNPCRCGYYLDSSHNCTCSARDIEHYRQKISGPILDRMDLLVYVKSMPKELFETQINNSLHKELYDSVHIQNRVRQCRETQKKRSLKLYNQTLLNSHLSQTQIFATTPFTPSIKKIIRLALDKYNLSTRGIIRVLRVARTIADLAGNSEILEKHLLEALGFRIIDF